MNLAKTVTRYDNGAWHATEDGKRTLCGMAVKTNLPHAAFRPDTLGACKRCAKVVRGG